MSNNGWIGVDLDGTLAHYEGWKGADHIGEPIPAMLARVRCWLAEGKNVKIFTARVFCRPSDDPHPAAHAQQVIEAYCLKHLGQVLPVTCVKDFAMIELWDDRAIQIIANTGERADGRD